ncbi:cation:proton antiporter [Paenibacillus gyeongsangnamensis]|uniref:hypothetical protein n=1 Tax=Paenibacillus gyeongsangnamensis TaxID=3388067 RepID=UPI002FCF5340
MILFLAAAVILFTLLAASVFLPLISKEESEEGETRKRMDVDEAKRKLLLSTIKKLRLEMNEENENEVFELIDEYKSMFQKMALEPSNLYQQRLNEIRLLALRAERKYIQDEMKKGAMEKEVFESFEKSLDSREEALASNVSSGIAFLIGKLIRGWKRSRIYYSKDRDDRIAKLRAVLDVQIKALQSALFALEYYSKERGDKDLVHAVTLEYKRIIDRLRKPTAPFHKKKQAQKEEFG